MSKIPVWDVNEVEEQLTAAFKNNSEIDLLKVIRDNSFLLHALYTRHGDSRPAFREVSFGAKLRCDFAWLNDNSDGPEWVVVEVEEPRMRLFNASGKPSAELNSAIEQIRSWQRYFEENPLEGKRIFGAVARFRYILVGGDKKSWSTEDAMKWRKHFNSNNNIEIRSADVFLRALRNYKEKNGMFYAFEENPQTLPFASLEAFWKGDGYMDQMRKLFP